MIMNTEEVKDKDYFIQEIINDLNYVQPDFMMFKNRDIWLYK